MGAPIHFHPRAKCFLVAICVTVAFCFESAAQSNDSFHPTPVFSDEISGRISPRDVGDARRTRHFYTFTGREGDIIVNLESSNLHGDVDLYTADSFRPLLKITLYGGSPTRASKSVYLRKDEPLVLRVEARAVGDSDGSYRVRFGGSFAPAPAGLSETPAQPTLPETKIEERRDTRPVTATGARIEVPATESASREEAKAETIPKEEDSERAEKAPSRRTEPSRSARRGRATSPARTRTRPNRPAPAKPAEAKEEADVGKVDGKVSDERETAPRADSVKKVEKSAPSRTPARPARREPRRTRRGTDSESARAPDRTPVARPGASEPAPTQRIIIVTKDGETIEHDMRIVRRVTIENNQVVINTRDGKTIKRPLADVLKMSIEP